MEACLLRAYWFMQSFGETHKVMPHRRRGKFLVRLYTAKHYLKEKVNFCTYLSKWRLTDKCCGVSYNPWLPLFCFFFLLLLLLLLLFFLSPPRQIHRVVAVLGTFTSSWMRWERRSQSGSRGVQLPDTLARCSGHCSCFSKLRTVTHSGDDADAAAAPSDDSTPTTSTTTTTLSLSLSLSLSLCISHHSYGLLVLETFIFPRSACCPDVFLSSVLNLRTIVSRCSGRRWCPRLVIIIIRFLKR